MADKQKIPDLSKYPLKGGRYSASAFANKENYKVFTHKGITYWKTYEGVFAPGITYDDATLKRRKQQRRGGSRGESQKRKELKRKTSKGGYTKLSDKQLAEVAKKEKLLKPGEDLDHVYDKFAYSSGPVENPEFRQPLDSKINRGKKVQEAGDFSRKMFETELNNPSASMSLDESLELAKDRDWLYKDFENKILARQAWDLGDNELGRALGLPPGQTYRGGMMTTLAEKDYLADKITGNLSEIEKTRYHFRDQINNKLNSIYTTDPSSELYSMGLWHDGKTLDDSWVKITRELNTDSGTFANGKWTPAPDPTARTNIDILSDIGQGKVDLKNKFQNLKRTLPPGE